MICDTNPYNNLDDKYKINFNNKIEHYLQIADIKKSDTAVVLDGALSRSIQTLKKCNFSEIHSVNIDRQTLDMQDDDVKKHKMPLLEYFSIKTTKPHKAIIADANGNIKTNSKFVRAAFKNGHIGKGTTMFFVCSKRGKLKRGHNSSIKRFATSVRKMAGELGLSCDKVYETEYGNPKIHRQRMYECLFIFDKK